MFLMHLVVTQHILFQICGTWQCFYRRENVKRIKLGGSNKLQLQFPRSNVNGYSDAYIAFAVQKR